MLNPIGSFVRERRQDLGLTQEQLAERVGGSYGQSDISRIERGHIELPRIGTLVKLAESLEVPVGDLLIASGWFEDAHFVTDSSAATSAQDNVLEDVLVRLEAELDAIHELERQAAQRTSELYRMIRDLKVTLKEPAVRMVAD
jgi:transcriptional regulator with XRE-family HTH domain